MKQLSPEHEFEQLHAQLSTAELERVSGGEADLKKCAWATVPWAVGGGLSGSHFKGWTGLAVGGLVSGAAAFTSTSECTDGLPSF